MEGTVQLLQYPTQDRRLHRKVASANVHAVRIYNIKHKIQAIVGTIQIGVIHEDTQCGMEI